MGGWRRRRHDVDRWQPSHSRIAAQREREDPHVQQPDLRVDQGPILPHVEVGKTTKSSPMGSIDHPFNPMSLALGAEATFAARTLDMDTKHTGDMLQAAYDHQGSAFVEIYQNCNVFNDKAFIALTGKDQRDNNRIFLEHGKQIRFGADMEKAVVLHNGEATIVDAASVDESSILVHDETNLTQAFAISRLSHTPTGPTPLGILRNVDIRGTYDDGVNAQLAEAKAKKGDGNVDDLIRSLGTWTVE